MFQTLNVFIQTFFGLDVIVPQVLKNKTVDLVLSGPNEGSNFGPYSYTRSGTIGAAYAAVYRGVSDTANLSEHVLNLYLVLYKSRVCLLAAMSF